MGEPARVTYDDLYYLTFPVNDATLKSQIRHAMGLGLKEAVGEPDRLNIVATGPSARAIEGRLDGPTLAVNGALEFYPEPDFYAACDPQALVANFLKSPPSGVVYYIASKCHPSVFRALSDRDVRLWHVDDLVPGGIACAPSITLTAINLFARMGWRRFRIWGWDCCFGDDGSHHVSDQPRPETAPVRLEVNGRIYNTTSTWWGEADSASRVLAIMDWLGVQVEIMGDGMVKAFRTSPATENPKATTA